MNKFSPVYRDFPLTASGVVFAGFSYPRRLWTLPRGPLSARLAEAKRGRWTSGYYLDRPAPGSSRHSFYLDEKAGGFALRWHWCDELPANWCGEYRAIVRHCGWFIDETESETIRGVVFKLPRSGGYLAGWSMGEGMASELDKSRVYATSFDAAWAADTMARDAAEVERQYQWVESVRAEMLEKLEQVRVLWVEAKSLSRELKQLQPEAAAPVAVVSAARARLRDLRTNIDQLLTDAHKLRDQIRDAA